MTDIRGIARFPYFRTVGDIWMWKYPERYSSSAYISKHIRPKNQVLKLRSVCHRSMGVDMGIFVTKLWLWAYKLCNMGSRVWWYLLMGAYHLGHITWIYVVKILSWVAESTFIKSGGILIWSHFQLEPFSTSVTHKDFLKIHSEIKIKGLKMDKMCLIWVIYGHMVRW